MKPLGILSRLVLVCLFTALVGVGCSSGGGTFIPPTGNFSGSWTIQVQGSVDIACSGDLADPPSDFCATFELMFSQDGSMVTGTFTDSCNSITGTIEGTVNGNVLQGVATYQNPTGPLAEVEFTATLSGNTISVNLTRYSEEGSAGECILTGSYEGTFTPTDFSGNWYSTLTFTSETCGFPELVGIMEASILEIDQTGREAMVDFFLICGEFLGTAPAMVNGNVLTISVEATGEVVPGCFLTISEVDTVSRSGNQFNGDAVLALSTSGICPEPLNCEFRGSITADSCPPADCTFQGICPPGPLSIRGPLMKSLPEMWRNRGQDR